MAGRTWELVLISPAAGLSVWSIWQVWAVLAGGLLFTGLLSAYLLATSKSGTHWEPRDHGLDGGLVSSLMDLL